MIIRTMEELKLEFCRQFENWKKDDQVFSFFRLDLKKFDLTKLKMEHHPYDSCIDLSQSDLSGADLSGAQLGSYYYRINERLSNQSVIFDSMPFAPPIKDGWIIADFHGATMWKTNLSGACLTRANFSFADLTCANFKKSNLTRANLRGATLEKAVFVGADLSEANLSLANLRGADLRGANLYGADISWGDFHGVDLRLASLNGCEMEGINVFSEHKVIVTKAQYEYIRRTHKSNSTYFMDNFTVKELES